MTSRKIDKSNPIVKVLMDRDDMTAKDAISLINEVREEIDLVLAEGSFTQAEDIFMDNFGLELDYLIYMI
jgi:hypothetical protein